MMRHKALILGERSAAKIIARQLEEEGCVPFFQQDFTSEVLPNLGSPQSLQEMAVLLKAYADIGGVSPFESGRDSESGSLLLVHPGVTSWGERPELQSLCQKLGLIFVGPSARVLSVFGDKLNFLGESEKIGIQNLILCYDPLHTVREIEASVQAQGLKFPLVVRAVKGGGSIGRRVIQDAEDLRQELPLWLDQLRHFQGEVILFLERYLDGARYIVAPFVRFKEGDKRVFPTLDASLQSRYRKVVEFCPASQIETHLKEQISDWVKQLADYFGYVGVGAFEFLVDASRAYLIEATPRLNTDFILWSKVAKTRGISWQLAALGICPTPDMLPENAWLSGICGRIYAEDSLLHLPQPGQILAQSEIRVWNNLQAELFSSYSVGDQVLPSDSGLIAQFVVQSDDRESLIPKAQALLKETWIAGTLQTNERFLFELLSHPWVRSEVFHAGFIDEEFVPAMKPSPEQIFLLKSACSLAENTGPVFGEEDGRVSGFALLSGQKVFVGVFYLETRWIARVDHWTTVLRKPERTRDKAVLSALTSGIVHSILFRSETAARSHAVLMIIESLGVFVPHSFPVPVTVLKWNVSAGDTVTFGQALASIQF